MTTTTTHVTDADAAGVSAPWMRAYSSPPIPLDGSLTRADLVRGLRLLFQRTRLDVANVDPAKEREPGSRPDAASADPAEEQGRQEYLTDVAAVLADVASQFGLSESEQVDILGEYATQLGIGG